MEKFVAGVKPRRNKQCHARNCARFNGCCGAVGRVPVYICCQFDNSAGCLSLCAKIFACLSRNMSSQVSKDVWFDLPVLCYLSTKRYGPHASESEKSRVRKRASRHALHSGRLFRVAGRRWREVPPVSDRIMLVAHTHHLCGHRGEKAVLKELRQWYFWEKMENDVKNTIARCSLCHRVKEALAADTSSNPDVDDRRRYAWGNSMPKRVVGGFMDESDTEAVHAPCSLDWWLDGETTLDS